MPIFTYKGYDTKSGALKKGKVEAEHPKAARMKVKQRDGVIVSDIKLETNLDKAKTGGSFQFFAPKVGLQDVAIFARQFATLQQAHVPLDESLKALTEQVDHVLLRSTVAEIKDKISEGKSLAEASSEYPTVFNKLYINMVRAGESSGTLGIVLERLADYFEKQIEIRGSIVSAITYPILMIVASFGIIAYLFISVVPKLTKVFENLRVTLPWYTKMLVGVSEFLQVYWYLVVLLGFGVYYLFHRWISTEKGKRTFDEFSLKLPLFGALILRIGVSRFTQTLSTLLSAGVPIIQALEITKNVITNVVIAQVVEEAKIAVQEGQSLANCIEKSGKFPGLVVHMIRTGEKTGQLEEMLKHVSTAYESEVERKIAAMISLIEPLMIIGMAGVTILIVMAMLIPMLSVMSQIR